MDLNKSLMSQYQNASSKRHRPVDSNVDPAPAVPNSDEAPTELAGDKTAPPGSTGKKRRVVYKVAAKYNGEDVAALSSSGGTKSYRSLRPDNRLCDLAGIDAALGQIKDMVLYPVKYPDLYEHLGVTAPCGLLFQGPSGCGKTTLANAIAGELDLPFFKASGPELIGGTSGESEERIRDVFNAAIAASPSILFIDALDVIAGKRELSQRGMDKRVIAQLCDCIDLLGLPQQDISKSEKSEEVDATIHDMIKEKIADDKKTPLVILIAATNKSDTLDTSVRGRFSREISLPVPDAESRTKILMIMTSKMLIASDVDLVSIGKATAGYVGADLNALVREAGMIAVSRIVETNDNTEKMNVGNENFNNNNNHQMDFTSAFVEMRDFLLASKSIQPTAKREGFAVVPDVTWKDVGALAEVREELLENVLDPIANPARFRSLGLEVPAGVLFFGPPGCGKTLLAKALANQSGANFISVKGPELLNMYVGESESKVRQVFSRARASAPCVVFFDELDALCPKRGSGGDSGSGVTERVVNQLLTELDGLESRKDVYVIAATNRLELIDDAMLRPGRLGKLLYVPLPNQQDRVGILTALTKGSKGISAISFDTANGGVDLEQLGFDERAEGFSGADLAELVREAGLAVIREWRAQTESNSFDNSALSGAQILGRHFEAAFKKVRPSVSAEDRVRYFKVQKYIKEGIGAIQALRMAASTKNM